MRKLTLRETKVLSPKVLKAKSKTTITKKPEKEVVPLPHPSPPSLHPSLLPTPGALDSNKNRSLVCSHLFIVHCKLSRDTAQGRRPLRILRASTFRRQTPRPIMVACLVRSSGGCCYGPSVTHVT